VRARVWCVLGETRRDQLDDRDPGRTRVHGLLRDAWPPSAGAADRHRVDIAANGRQTVTTLLQPTRSRRPCGVPRDCSRARPLVCRAPKLARRAWTVRVLPLVRQQATPPRAAGALAESRRQAAQPRPRAGHRVRLAYGPMWSVTTCARSTGARLLDRGDDPDLRPERDRRLMIVLDTGRSRPVASATFPPGRLDGPRLAALRLASRAGDRVDPNRVDRQVARVCRARLVRTAGRAGQWHGTLEPSLVESDSPGSSPKCCAAAGTGPGVLLTGLDPTHWNKACCRCCGR